MRGPQILAVVMIWWFWCSLQDIVGIGAEPLKFSQLQDFLIEYLRCIPGGLQSQWLLHTSPPLQPLTLRADRLPSEAIPATISWIFLNYKRVFIYVCLYHIYQWNPKRSPSAANSEGSKCSPIHPGPWPKSARPFPCAMQQLRSPELRIWSLWDAKYPQNPSHWCEMLGI